MADDTPDPELGEGVDPFDEAHSMLRFARTDWLTGVGDVSLKLLEQAIDLGAALGDISWDEAVAAYQALAQRVIAERMMQRPTPESRQAFLARLHVTRGNPSCVCRTEGCGHTASQHTGPNGACVVCGRECWS